MLCLAELGDEVELGDGDRVCGDPVRDAPLRGAGFGVSEETRGDGGRLSAESQLLRGGTDGRLRLGCAGFSFKTSLFAFTGPPDRKAPIPVATDPRCF